MSWSVRAGEERRGIDLHNRTAAQPLFTDGNYWNQYRTFAAFTLQKTFFSTLKTHTKLTGNLIHNPIQGSYSFNQIMPAFVNLYGGQWLTEYNSIVQGSQEFALLPTNTFVLLYQFGNWENDLVLNPTFNERLATKHTKPTSVAANQLA